MLVVVNWEALGNDLSQSFHHKRETAERIVNCCGKQLDLFVTDGGLFDKDLAVDGVITILGAPGYMPLSASSYGPDLPPGPFFF